MRIHMFSLHGLFRGSDLEIGRDADNGGQIIYVIELAQALSRLPEVDHVHLFTRRIDDPSYSQDYAAPVEVVNEKFDIRRVACGGKKYLLKESLWPHLDEYVANAIQYMKAERILPEWIHSHYADAGYVAAELSAHLHVPFVHSAHSLGIPKLEKLLNAGVPRQESYQKYQFERRFEAEESVLANSEFVVTSTEREVGLFGDYSNSEYAEYHVLPPGIDFGRFYPYYEEVPDGCARGDDEKQAAQMAGERIARFLNDPAKPLILAVCRPDKRKNIDGLLHAYGTDLQLQAVANLAIFAGIRGDIENMAEGAKDVLTEILLLMDKYNLYGKLAIPKQHDTEWEVPELYRLAARQKGVFVNVALTEPFGLTILEATACGLPVVATNHGGPSEILPKCQNGALVDPNDTQALQEALKSILFDEENWQALSNKGIRNVREHFSWETHSRRYLELVQSNLKNSSGVGIKMSTKNPTVEKRLTTAERMVVSDIDGTLVSEHGNYEGLDELKEVLSRRGDEFVFAVATGRSLELVRDILLEHDICKPDVVISSVGAYIHYGLEDHTADKRWQQFISFRWDRQRIADLLRDFPGIELQEEAAQNPYKLSYYVEKDGFSFELLMDRLRPLRSRLNVIFSRDAFLDIMPKRSSKGRAVRYLCQKWSIPLKHTVVCGDSGNDIDMFEGSARGVVVGNHAEELAQLTLKRNNYFAKGESASGVLEGLRRFGMIQ